MSIRILIVDDDDIITSLWVDYFSISTKYCIDTANSGENGIVKLKNNQYDIVITDLKMPGLSGIDVVEAVKSMSPETEVIVMTSYGTIETAVEAIKKGAFDFILKPLDFNRIMMLLQKCYQHMTYKKENQDLKELNVKLQELNEEKEKFITITSHELRTPTNSVIGMTDILIDCIKNDLGNKYDRELTLLHTAGTNLREIVEDMYSLAIAKKGRLQLEKARIELDFLKEELYRLFDLYSKDRKFDFQFENKLKYNKFYGDFRKIKQAVGTVLQNAVKYTLDGGLIKLIFDEETIDGLNYFKIEVSDTGIGIAQEYQDKIFNYFYEVQDSVKHHSSKSAFMGGGLGIGLSIAKEIVTAHDGFIKVESEVGKGSIFKLYFVGGLS